MKCVALILAACIASSSAAQFSPPGADPRSKPAKEKAAAYKIVMEVEWIQPAPFDTQQIDILAQFEQRIGAAKSDPERKRLESQRDSYRDRCLNRVGRVVFGRHLGWEPPDEPESILVQVGDRAQTSITVLKHESADQLRWKRRDDLVAVELPPRLNRPLSDLKVGEFLEIDDPEWSFELHQMMQGPRIGDRIQGWIAQNRIRAIDQPVWWQPPPIGFDAPWRIDSISGISLQVTNLTQIGFEKSSQSQRFEIQVEVLNQSPKLQSITCRAVLLDMHDRIVAWTKPSTHSLSGSNAFQVGAYADPVNAPWISSARIHVQAVRHSAP